MYSGAYTEFLHCLCTAADLLIVGMVHFVTAVCGKKLHRPLLESAFVQDLAGSLLQVLKEVWGRCMWFIYPQVHAGKSMSPDHSSYFVSNAGCTRQGSSQSRHQQ